MRDNSEINNFESVADTWWDPDGAFRPLHDITPARLEYISNRANLRAHSDKRPNEQPNGQHVLDIGCGGGLLCEEMARLGAKVTGVDAGEKAIAIARAHAEKSNLNIEYIHSSFEDYAACAEARFSVITCLELIEHVSEPAALVSSCARLLKPGGHLFFSTINRTLRAWLSAIIGAEYVLKLLPVGTHHYDRLVRPSELARWALNQGLEIKEISGLSYHPVTRHCTIGNSIDVNYFMHCVNPRHPRKNA